MLGGITVPTSYTFSYKFRCLCYDESLPQLLIKLRVVQRPRSTVCVENVQKLSIMNIGIQAIEEREGDYTQAQLAAKGNSNH